VSVIDDNHLPALPASPPLTTHLLLAGVESPVAVIVEKLSPHFADIRSAWKALLRDKLKLSTSEIRTISALKIESQKENLCTGNFKSYVLWLEEQGELFDRRAIPMDRAIAALALYFEACIPFLVADPGPLPGAALLRFVSESELALILGFSRHRQEKWSEMENRLVEAEQRLRRFSVHLVHAYEQTGRRIARDLHDEIGHNLLVLKLYLELMNMDLKEGHPEQLITKLDEAVGLIGHAIEGVRRLAFNLGPAILEEAGFLPTLRRYAKQFEDRTGIKTHFKVQLTVKLPSIFEVTLYRVVQGALSNVVEHSRAKNVRLSLTARRGRLLMAISDDGRGFDVQKTSMDPHQAFGLMTIRQRIELLGGKLRVDSKIGAVGRKTGGTRIEVEIPLEDIEAA
jgi:two-component system sensor histidine kinase DegS